jgi:hypothetical protein
MQNLGNGNLLENVNFQDEEGDMRTIGCWEERFWDRKVDSTDCKSYVTVGLLRQYGLVMVSTLILIYCRCKFVVVKVRNNRVTTMHCHTVSVY